MKYQKSTFRLLSKPIMAFGIICCLINSNTACAQPETPVENESHLISSVRQLTFDGRRAGEGYFSADGSKMVFQSERDASNPFFQIFMLDFEFGDISPVSPGHGKTTCAWVHPDAKSVLFASTHNDPQAREKQRQEIEFRESGQTKRYSWDYDKQYELYSFDTESKSYNRLTSEKGYDAEGSYSPDGKLIAFASNRLGYSRKLTDEQKKAFDVDLAFMMDIYIMNSDGTNVRQLTDIDGYDGGPFFSPDGKRICWRRFSENGLTAEILSMNIDGSDQKQLTKMGSMSWAPFYHPSGKYLVFTTNKHGFANFELYLVDVEGKSPLVRVTETAGFDGLASFSPDGKKLTWTSNRNAKKKSQIYLGDWNHEHALKLLRLDSKNSDEEKAAASLGVDSAKKTSFDFEARDIVRHVDYLCRRELGGRMTGSLGEKQATAYVAAYLDHLGLSPGGDNGSWYQSFEFPAGAKLGSDNRLRVISGDSDAEEFEADEQWRPLTFSKTGEIEKGDVVFAGYGISAPKQDKQPAYDSYFDLDVTGKWVLVLRYLPEDVEESRRQFLAQHSSLRKKAMVARDKGALGIIVVSGPKSNVKQQLVALKNDFSNAGSSVAAISVTDKLANEWLGKTNRDLSVLQTQLDSGKHLNGFAIPSLAMSANIAVEQIVGQGRNVVGRLMASELPSEQAILVGAHIDHLGKGTGGSLARSDEKGQIHVGADDNASGVAALLEIAEYLSGLKRSGKLTMRRDFVFAAWSGEELGLHGSQHFVNARIPRSENQNRDAESGSPTQAYNGDPHDLNQMARYNEQFISNFDPENYTADQLKLLESNASDMQVVVKLMSSPAASGDGRNNDTVKSFATMVARSNELIKQAGSATGPNSGDNSKATPPAIAACLNMDMVGRMENKVVLQGIGSSNDWNRIIEKANVVVGLPIELSDDTQLPTDASSFYRAGVPILSAFTGSHTDYHTPRDTPEKLNYPAAARIAKLMGLVARDLVIRENVLDYVKRSEQKKKRVASTGRRARLGTVPNYTKKVDGVLLDDVAPDGPAAIAGLKRGDIIIELAGKKIENIYDLQFAIDLLKVGKETSITVRRKENEIKLTVTPGSRD